MEDNDIEVWVDIENYIGYYQVSSKGRVRSLDRVIEYIDGRIAKLKGRVLSSYFKPDSGLGVNLCKDCKSVKFTIARLLWVAFNKDKPLPNLITYKDGNMENICLNNLTSRDK